MKEIFKFEFLIEDNFKYKIAYFTIEIDKNHKELIKFVNDYKSDFAKLTENSEENYGIHDVSFSPDKELFGFTSYEVEEDSIPELMKSYKDLFIKKGFEVNKIKYIEEFYQEDEGDYDEKLALVESRYDDILKELK
jgi:hypothetical protein